ncbi:MAG: LysR family transcriptional regulator, partial [Rhodobacteraceae bacterium]|nr:LysR family transcriptional regulator [Paracoccaceae bacterium]
MESFSLASRELNVTPGAVAQQVKTLEAWLGRDLFDRLPQGLRLNECGRSALPSLINAFDALGSAVHDLRKAGEPASFRIAALPSVAQLWLAPRLPALRSAYPDLTISVIAMEQPPNLIREPFDLAVFFGQELADGIADTVLAEAERFPVCSPGLAERLACPEDLKGWTLLHDATWRGDWAKWLNFASASGIDAAMGPVFSLYSLAVEEAKQGAGVLLGNQPLIEAELRCGALVKAFERSINSGGALTAAF